MATEAEQALFESMGAAGALVAAGDMRGACDRLATAIAAADGNAPDELSRAAFEGYSLLGNFADYARLDASAAEQIVETETELKEHHLSTALSRARCDLVIVRARYYVAGPALTAEQGRPPLLAMAELGGSLESDCLSGARFLVECYNASGDSAGVSSLLLSMFNVVDGSRLADSEDGVIIASRLAWALLNENRIEDARTVSEPALNRLRILAKARVDAGQPTAQEVYLLASALLTASHLSITEAASRGALLRRHKLLDEAIALYDAARDAHRATDGPDAAAVATSQAKLARSMRERPATGYVVFEDTNWVVGGSTSVVDQGLEQALRRSVFR
ncbi:hypothetical protein FHT44_006286 [Mycolicibacterium sp. BK634]|uniref:hypothetical protein n=1 Tax=Mycolicibacterium sp. BK634 TaxID=2587099 RepID=UPI00160B30CD|nr:hypothetical protein [Mycolicibacterium sp. BK634]MBB3753764.1 hypothetical protein [Mycolicibacterium sp. BK634]